MGGTFHLGTSGFGYDEWRGTFYPPTVKRRDMLTYYAERFRSVEINYTFRRRASERTIVTWRDATPEGFVFALKAHSRITHTLRLRASESASAFLETVKPLGTRLGPILFQCPPTLRYDRETIERFLAQLPTNFRYAFEFRHRSWEEARDLLRARGAAWCVAETDESGTLDSDVPPTPFAYLRLRKREYTEDALSGWGRRIAQALTGGNDVYCYFKHEEKAAGPAFAEQLASLVELERDSPSRVDDSAERRGS